MIAKIIFFSALLLGAHPLTASPPTDLSIYVLMGQSNMSGSGKLSELPGGFPRHRSSIWLFSNAWKWEPAQEPVDSSVGQIDEVSLDPAPGVGVGPGLAFADALVDHYPKRMIALVPCAKGGTTVRQWQRSGHNPGDRKTLYGSCLERMRAAMKFGTIKAILWHQGESDAKKTENEGPNFASAKSWPGEFKQIVRDLRSDLQLESLPVVFAQIGNLLPDRIYNRPPDYLSYWDEVKRQQATVRIAHTKMIVTEDLEVGLDGLHLTTAAQLILGPRFAKAVSELEASAPTESPNAQVSNGR